MSTRITKPRLHKRFEISEEEFDILLLNSSRILRITNEVDVYYDSNQKLADAGVTLRVRSVDGVELISTVCLKLAKEQNFIEIEYRLHKDNPHEAILVGCPSSLRLYDFPEEIKTRLEELQITSLYQVGSLHCTRRVVYYNQGLSMQLSDMVMENESIVRQVVVEVDSPEKMAEIEDVISFLTPKALLTTETKVQRCMEAKNTTLKRRNDPMTAEDLIKYLQSLDPKTRILVEGYEGGYDDLYINPDIEVTLHTNVYTHEGQHDEYHDWEEIDPEHKPVRVIVLKSNHQTST